jgi:hypothetical protein
MNFTAQKTVEQNKLFLGNKILVLGLDMKEQNITGREIY